MLTGREVAAQETVHRPQAGRASSSTVPSRSLDSLWIGDKRFNSRSITIIEIQSTVMSKIEINNQ